jgi:hypothetical protein
MKSLVRWAARLYPAAWRARYGVELEALLEDARPRGGDLRDVLRGALFMQMTSLSFWKILAGCTLAGVLAAGIWSATLPNRYVSTAVVRISAGPSATDGEAKWAALGRVQAVLSRTSLATIILQQNLYAKERLSYPMEDVTQEMRSRHLRIQTIDAASGMTFAVSFDNENPAAARATVRAIVSSLAERHVLQGTGAADMEVLDSPSLPSQPVSPNRMQAIGGGLWGGLVLGLVCGAIWSMARSKGRWSMRWIGGLAAAGMAVGLAIAFLIPSEYVSTAVMRTADGSKLPSTIAQILSEDSLAAIIREDHLYSRELSRSSMHDVVQKMRDEHIRVQGLEGAALTISFTYHDRLGAQAVTRDLVARIIAVNGVPPSATEVLDSASLPRTPNYPNRLIIGTLGTAMGILLGLGVSRFGRMKPGTA